MAEIITSAEGAAALPARTRVAIDGWDDVLTKGADGEWRGGPYVLGDRVWVGLPEDIEAYLPVTVLYRPDAPADAARPGVDREALAAEHARVRRGREFTHHRYDADPPQSTDYIAADVTAAVLAAQPTIPAQVDPWSDEPAPTPASAVEYGTVVSSTWVGGGSSPEEPGAQFVVVDVPYPCRRFGYGEEVTILPRDATPAPVDGDAVETVTRAEAERMVAEQREMDLAMHQAYRPEVVAEVAVHLSEDTDWGAVAAWCGGMIRNSEDPSGEYVSDLHIPGVGTAWQGAWIVQRHDLTFEIRATVEGPSEASVAALAAARADAPSVTGEQVEAVWAQTGTEVYTVHGLRVDPSSRIAAPERRRRFLAALGITVEWGAERG